MPRSFAVTFDYRCPFAFNGHTAVVAALRAGADYDVQFAPFSLDQVHIEEGEPPVWERDPSEWGSGVLALCFGIAARDHFPDQFLDAHMELFKARHERSEQLADEAVLRAAVARAGLDADAVAELAHKDTTIATLAREHTALVDEHAVFGVPTFIAGDEAVFVRFMEREQVDDLARVVDLLDFTRLNEFKRTKIPR